jgi:hypothetical protein
VKNGKGTITKWIRAFRRYERHLGTAAALELLELPAKERPKLGKEKAARGP